MDFDLWFDVRTANAFFFNCKKVLNNLKLFIIKIEFVNQTKLELTEKYQLNFNFKKLS
jgi:hypothetical protein